MTDAAPSAAATRVDDRDVEPVEIPDATPVVGSWLYVGAEESVGESRRALLVERGVTHVISTMRRPPPWLLDRTNPPPFEHLHVKVEDTKAADMSQHFDVISDFISRAKQARGRVVVHCAFGQSRSVTAAAAHLVSHEGFTLGEALERIRSRRPKACPNPSFMVQLVQHEINLRGAPSDLRGFPSLPPRWQFVEWRDPLRAAVRLVSCHGRLLRVKEVSRYPRVYSITGFVSQEEAAEIRKVAEPELHPSLVVRHERDDSGDGGIDDDKEQAAWKGERSEGRTSWNCRVPVKHPAVRGAIQRACFLTNLLPSHSEPAQVVRYLPSQQYRPHYDWFDPNAGESFRRKTACGGQRAVTCLVYLAEPERGGRTSFPKLGLGFEPRVGEAVLWWNVNEAGKEDMGTLHAGDPVLAGEKWALNIWLRQHPRRCGGGGELNGNDGTGAKEGGDKDVDRNGTDRSYRLADTISTLSISR